MPAPRLRVLESGIATRHVPARARDQAHPIAAYSFVNIEIEGRGIATGRGCASGLSASTVDVAVQCASAYVSFKRRDTAFGHHTFRVGALTANLSRDEASDIRTGCSLMDAAILDAVLLAFGCSFFKGMSLNIAEIETPIVPLLADRSIQRFLKNRSGAGRNTATQSLRPDAFTRPADRDEQSAWPAHDPALAAEQVEASAGAETRLLAPETLSRPPVSAHINLYDTLIDTAMGKRCQTSRPPTHADEPLSASQRHGLICFLRQTDDDCTGHAVSSAVKTAAVLKPGFASYAINTPADLVWR